MPERVPRLFNLRDKPIPSGVIRVDRGTDWGNPFVMRNEQDRDRVCNLFMRYAEFRLTIDPTWLDPLKGKDLACWCVPLRCHAQTLLRMANE